MKNPYWSSEGQTHPISVDEIQRLCFEVVNIVAASGELAGDRMDIEQGSLIFQLHQQYAETELCKKLLRIAVLVRTFDDLASGSVSAEEYKEHAKKTSGEHEIGDLTVAGKAVELNLREACNKIIHAQEIRAIYDDAVEFSGDEMVNRRWFCDGQVELKGTQQGRKWEASVYVYPLAETVLERIQFRF
jgi:hypothetical protein